MIDRSRLPKPGNREKSCALECAVLAQQSAQSHLIGMLLVLQLEMYKEALKALKEGGMGYGTKAGAFSRM